jgi:hypothetical protein|tara:strand:+ start:1355 stop:1564 length:210 start_codon:yes stop_codon:yes gene_type:complete
MSTNKRKFIRPLSRPGDLPGLQGEVYIVYKYEAKRLESEGPYNDPTVATDWMIKLLAQGICAWIVSYDA